MSILNRLHSKVILAFLTTALTVSLCSITQAAPNKKNPTSKLFVADVEGLSSINTGEKIEDLTKKSVHTAEGVILETNSDARSAIVLSNGTGISFAPSTKMEVARFQQEPFTPNRTDLETEPSMSQTMAYIPQGRLGICTSKLVAGSNMLFKSLHSSVNVRGGKIAIESNDNETVISLIDGDVTVGGNDSRAGQPLKPGEQAVISRANPPTPATIIIRPIPQKDRKSIEEETAMACMAKRTVYFDVAERRNKNANGEDTDVFSQEEPEQEIKAVEVLPGNIKGPNTVSPFKIERGIGS